MSLRGRFGRSPQVLRDRRLDRQLRDDGYVLLDLFDHADVAHFAAVAEQMLERYPMPWDPTGFSTTLRTEPCSTETDAALRPVVAAKLRGTIVTETVFYSTFVMKQARAGDLPPHVDWQMVDDGSVRTFGCWTPLVDTIRGHGAIGVVPGSHRLVDFDRTPEEPGHEWTEAFVATGVEQRYLDVNAGQCMLYDHRLVHFSEPNEADHPRIAVNSAICPSHLASHAEERLRSMMARGMAGHGSDPQVTPTEPAQARSTIRPSTERT